jgi:hypothetical protein
MLCTWTLVTHAKKWQYWLIRILNDKSNKIAVGQGVAALSANISIINFHVFPDTSQKEDSEHIYKLIWDTWWDNFSWFDRGWWIQKCLVVRGLQRARQISGARPMVIRHLNLTHVWKNTARWVTLKHYANQSEARLGNISVSAYEIGNKVGVRV